MNEIKQTVAKAVRDSINLEAVRSLDNVERVTTSQVSDLQTQIRVVTLSQGVHYFLVKVQEQL